MERTAVTSSNIVSMGHDPETGSMHVEFKSGDVYEYPDVPEEKYRAMMEAPSIGSAFHAIFVRTKYPFVKLPQPPE